jgi:hypothetical protein
VCRYWCNPAHFPAVHSVLWTFRGTTIYIIAFVRDDSAGQSVYTRLEFMASRCGAGSLDAGPVRLPLRDLEILDCENGTSFSPAV